MYLSAGFLVPQHNLGFCVCACSYVTVKLSVSMKSVMMVCERKGDRLDDGESPCREYLSELLFVIMSLRMCAHDPFL